MGRRRGVDGEEEQEAKVRINEAGGGPEDEEKHWTKAGRKEQRAKRRPGRQRGTARGWGGQVATHEFVHP